MESFDIAPQKTAHACGHHNDDNCPGDQYAAHRGVHDRSHPSRAKKCSGSFFSDFTLRKISVSAKANTRTPFWKMWRVAS
jgi:hypothetical protein